MIMAVLTVANRLDFGSFIRWRRLRKAYRKIKTGNKAKKKKKTPKSIQHRSQFRKKHKREDFLFLNLERCVLGRRKLKCSASVQPLK